MLVTGRVKSMRTRLWIPCLALGCVCLPEYAAAQQNQSASQPRETVARPMTEREQRRRDERLRRELERERQRRDEAVAEATASATSTSQSSRRFIGRMDEPPQSRLWRRLAASALWSNPAP